MLAAPDPSASPARPPDPAPPAGRVPAIAAAVALAAAPFLPRPALVAVAVALLIAALGCHRRGNATVRNAALLVAIALASLLLPAGAGAWPAPLVVVIAAKLHPRLRGPDGLVAWLRRGALSRSDLAWVAAVVAASAVALVAWTLLRRPHVADLTEALPRLAPWLLLAGGTAWAALNAFGEEAIFRGALWDALERAFGIRAALAIQALAFGLLHWRGFPRGADGVALAAVYGAMLGLIRRKTGGLLAPWLAHVFADVVILGLLIALR